MTTTQACPLCDRDATCAVVHQPHGKRFACAACGTFFIDVSSEVHIAGLPEVFKTEYREKLQKKAKACATSGLLVMRKPRSDELGGDGYGIARTTMIAECVSHDSNP